MDNRKYIRRHAKLILDKIENYKNKNLRLDYLIENLEELIEEIKSKDIEKGKILRSHWEDIELIYAYALYKIEEGERNFFTKEELDKINKLIERIEIYIRESRMIEYEDEEEYIQEKINENYEF